MLNFKLSLPQLLENLNFSDDSAVSEMLFILSCYANNQAALAKNEQDTRITLKWQKLADMLDHACDVLDENTDDDLCFLLY